MKACLEGIRILDCTIWQVGPVATSMLGDLGAEVIKVEHPQQGDPGRGLEFILGAIDIRLPTGGSAYFEAMNRNKKSITINLKNERGREALYRLVEKSDVFVQNMRPGTAEGLGIDYKTLRRINPKIIYASSSALGSRGEEGSKPGFDANGQARGGLMFSFAEPGMPPLHGTGAPADQTTGIMLAYGILAALLARERTGVGQEVEVSLLASIMWLLQCSVGIRCLLGEKWEWSQASRSAARNPMYNCYRCADEKWLMLSMIQSDRWWPDFCKAIDHPELEKDARFEDSAKRRENCVELVSILDEVFATKPRAEWEGLLQANDLLFERIQQASDLLDDPQVIANDYIVEVEHPILGLSKWVNCPVKLSETPGVIRSPGCEFGQYTEQVLLELGGYTWDEIAQLKEVGAI